MKVLFEGSQILVAEIRSGFKPTLVIVGNGYSIGDPFFAFPNYKLFGRMGTVVAVFFKKECTGLEDAQVELAQFINEVYDKYEKVVLYGQSKCGVMFYNILSLLQKPVVTISVSAPFKGTFWADCKAVKEKLWTSRSLVQKIFKGWQYLLYQKIFSNHPVDRDLIPGSAYLTKERVIPKCHKTVCVTAYCGDPTDELLKMNFKNAFCATLNKFLADENDEDHIGDGIVLSESQYSENADFHHTIVSCHMTSFNDGIHIIRRFM